jgi:PIN domain nuclease of toxin-antitoxin system
MRLLLDTHLLIWAAAGVGLSATADALVRDEANVPMFSAASIWEVAIKAPLRRPDFGADPAILRRALLDNGYVELPVWSEHAAAVAHLPLIHKDPFDRLLIAQAVSEGAVLLTSDAIIAKYPGPIRRV